jgi:hypothetical protein
MPAQPRFRIHFNSALRAASVGVLVVGGLAISPLAASAATGTPKPHVCSGTFAKPGVLSGTINGKVVVKGFCGVSAGQATVKGDVVVTSGSVLASVFGQNHRTHHGASGLSVGGDVVVQHNATALLGCDPSSSPCIDDPSAKKPTLFSHTQILHDLSANEALGVIVHNTSIGGNVTSTGGGGGVNCTPSGFFKLIKSPVFSAYEDTSVNGNVSISGMKSCWLGLARLKAGQDVSVIGNTLADPDAIEIVSNHISGDLICKQNSRTWDSGDLSNNLFPRQPQPNTVAGKRVGQCVLNSPTSPKDKPGPGPF